MNAANDTVDVLGLRVARIDRTGLLALLAESVSDGSRLTLTFANPNYVMATRKDPALRELINGFDLVLADGWGVVLATKIFGRPVPDRMANDDLTELLFGESAERGWRHYLFGNAPGVAEEAGANLLTWFPGLEIVGTEHGLWADENGEIGPQEAEKIIAAINDADPDILHVGLGTPLQQRFVAAHRDRLDARVILTCGAYFEHLVEGRDYYPAWILKLRLGWLYRFYREPRRLWYRYTVELSSYVLQILGHRLRHGRQL